MYVCMYDSWHQAEVGDSPRLKLLPVILGVGRNPNPFPVYSIRSSSVRCDTLTCLHAHMRGIFDSGFERI